MTRTEFVRQYARASGASDEFAGIGLIDIGGATLVALPCGCRECQDNSSGWVMLTANSVLDHLFFNAPDKLRDAYREVVREHDRG